MTKLQDTQKAIEELKELSELLYTAPEGKLLEIYPKFEHFKDKLNALLSTITRYRIQIQSPDPVFGPKTLKTVEGVVSDYDKLYEIYQENLHDVFTPLETAYREEFNGATEGTGEKTGTELVRSVVEETQSQLTKIEEFKKKLQQNQTVKHVDFHTIPNQETLLTDVLNKVLKVYREDPCDNLERVLCDVYEAHAEEFVKIIENITNLIREISKRPDELSLRVLRINNEKLQEDFLTHYNSVKLLKFIGFKVTTTEDINEVLTNLKMKFGEEYFLYLHEPDMFTMYNKWRAWLDNINSISDVLTNFLAKFKNLKKSDTDPKSLIINSLT